MAAVDHWSQEIVYFSEMLARPNEHGSIAILIADFQLLPLAQRTNLRALAQSIINGVSST
jgi:hypothetical protein